MVQAGGPAAGKTLEEDYADCIGSCGGAGGCRVKGCIIKDLREAQAKIFRKAWGCSEFEAGQCPQWIYLSEE